MPSQGPARESGLRQPPIRAFRDDMIIVAKIILEAVRTLYRVLENPLPGLGCSSSLPSQRVLCWNRGSVRRGCSLDRNDSVVSQWVVMLWLDLDWHGTVSPMRRHEPKDLPCFGVEGWGCKGWSALERVEGQFSAVTKRKHTPGYSCYPLNLLAWERERREVEHKVCCKDVCKIQCEKEL